MPHAFIIWSVFCDILFLSTFAIHKDLPRHLHTFQHITYWRAIIGVWVCSKLTLRLSSQKCNQEIYFEFHTSSLLSTLARLVIAKIYMCTHIMGLCLYVCSQDMSEWGWVKINVILYVVVSGVFIAVNNIRYMYVIQITELLT